METKVLDINFDLDKEKVQEIEVNRELASIAINSDFDEDEYLQENPSQNKDRVNGNHIIAQPVVHFQKIPPELVDLMFKEIEQMPTIDFPNADVGSGEQPVHDLEIRNTKLNWWPEDHWACAVISYYIRLANMGCWEYDINHMQGLQISTYEKDGHYVWHSDYGTSDDNRFTRKLSASLLVSDPSEYEGGEFEFIDYHNNTLQAPKEKGTLVIFDSRIPHRVTPITKGKRISIVAWMLGPKLK